MAGEDEVVPIPRKKLAKIRRKERAKEKKRKAKEEALKATSKATTDKLGGNMNKIGISHNAIHDDFPLVTREPLQNPSIAAQMQKSEKESDMKGSLQKKLITKEGFETKQTSDASISPVTVKESDSTIKMREVCQSMAALKICSSSSDTSLTSFGKGNDYHMFSNVDMATEGNLNKVKKLSHSAEEAVQNSSLKKVADDDDGIHLQATTTLISQVSQRTSNNGDNHLNVQKLKNSENAKRPLETTKTKTPEDVACSDNVLLDKQILLKKLGLSRPPVTKIDVFCVVDILYRRFVQRMKKANILLTSPSTSPPLPESYKKREYSEIFGQDSSSISPNEPDFKNEQYVLRNMTVGCDGSSDSVPNQGHRFSVSASGESPSGYKAEDIVSLETRRSLDKNELKKKVTVREREAKEVKPTIIKMPNNPSFSPSIENADIKSHQKMTASDKVTYEEVQLPKTLQCKRHTADESHIPSTQRASPLRTSPSLPPTEKLTDTSTLLVSFDTLSVSTNPLAVSTNTLNVSTIHGPPCGNGSSSSQGQGNENKSCSTHQRNEQVTDGFPETGNPSCTRTSTTHALPQKPPTEVSPSRSNSQQTLSLEERRRLAKIGRRKRAKARKLAAKQALTTVTKEED